MTEKASGNLFLLQENRTLLFTGHGAQTGILCVSLCVFKAHNFPLTANARKKKRTEGTGGTQLFEEEAK